ncbi:MAG: hypothetical protein DRH15_09665 [Deltaproteobacteria bacterium]|nr:MAG: hypothetical protein DRH15_09665 [Deltaproteobacteria bacterium]
MGLYELIEPIYKSDDLSAIIGAYQEIVHHRMPSVICLGGKGTSGKSWWHAVLAYKITYKEGLNDDLYKMYVYDPDFPWNDERFIAIRVQRAVPNNILIKYDPVEVFFTVPTEDILSAFPLIGGTILEILFED